MLGSRRTEGSSEENSAEISPLESLLQRAWLQSYKPKLQRRVASAPYTDVSVEKRGGSLPSLPVLSEIVSGQAGDEEGPEKFYFHKPRLDASTVFISRFALPELKCYSKKTYIPESVSLVSWTQQVPGYGSPQVLKSLGDFPTHSNESRTCKARNLSDTTQSEGCSDGSVDFEGQIQPLASYLDSILTEENLEVEKAMLHETTAYQAMAKEISDLIGLESVAETEESDVANHDSCWADVESYYTEPEMCMVEKSSAYQAMAKEIAELISPQSVVGDAGSTNVINEEISVRVDFNMESATQKMMEAYTCMLSKHLADVSINSGNVDSSNWSDDTDPILIYFEDDWKVYLQTLNQNFTPTSNFDFNMLLCGTGGGSEASTDNAVASSSCGNLTELLYRCAFAVNQGNVQNATDLLAELWKKSSAHGNGTERMAHYFMEALVAKMSETGEQLYTVIKNNCPSAGTLFAALRLYVENCPYVKLCHFHCIKTILDACEGATRVHVVYYGIQYAVEFPSLIQQLSQRPGGPPHLRITGIDSPTPGNDPALRINETGCRLAAFAKEFNVPFEFIALAGNWESFTARDVNLRDDEVLVVFSDMLHHLLDESVLATSPREAVLRKIRSMNPKVFIIAALNGGYNAPFFMTRFRECVKFYSALFESMRISMPPDDPDRVIIEREIFGLEIMNIVACDGQTRVQRAEPYRQWHNRLQRAGFTQLPLDPTVFSKITSMMGAFHKDFGVGKDDGWLLMGIRNQIVKACSAWEPKSL